MGIRLAVDIFDLNGEFIRKLRNDLGWSRELLSEKSGVPPGTIQKIEDGVSKNPGIETLKLLLKPMLPAQPSEDQKEILEAIPQINDKLVLDTLLNVIRMFFGAKNDKSRRVL